MGRLTKQETKQHDKAVELLKGDLASDDVEFIYRNWNPLASHNITKNAAFFTPWDLATDFAIFAGVKGRVIDLCAGIGILARRVLDHDRFGGSPDITEMVCLEINPEFVEIGQKLVPEAKWICTSVFDVGALIELGEFDCSVSNPPFGNIPIREQPKWIEYKGPMHFMVAEVALRLSYSGGSFILPSADVWHPGDRDARESSFLRKFTDKWKGVKVIPMPLDTSAYIGFDSTDIRVTCVDIDTSDAIYLKRPVGFEEVTDQRKAQEQRQKAKERVDRIAAEVIEETRLIEEKRLKKQKQKEELEQRQMRFV